MRFLRYLLPLFGFLILAGFLARGLRLDPREVPSPLIGKRAPSFALPRLDDPAVVFRRDDMLGKVWMLNVWASWCVACRAEHPLLLAFAQRKRVPLYGLDYKDNRPDARDWLNNHGDPYDASLFDEQGRIGIDFGVYGVPETFIIDKHGVIRLKHTGPLTREVLRDQIEPMLADLNA